MLDTGSSRRAHLAFSLRLRMLDARARRSHRRPPDLPFGSLRSRGAPAGASPSLARPCAAIARFHANPRRGFAAPPRLCPAPRRIRRTPRKFRRPPLRVWVAPHSPCLSRPHGRPSTRLRPRRAAARFRAADARTRDETPYGLREPPGNSDDASSRTYSSRASLQTDQRVRFADFAGTRAASTRRRAPGPRARPRPSTTTASLPANQASLRSFDRPLSIPSRTPREPSASPRAYREAPPVSRASPASPRDALAPHRTLRRPPGSLARTPGGSPRARSPSPRRSRGAYFTMNEAIELQFCSPVRSSGWTRKK
jgi:hypothetical protein